MGLRCLLAAALAVCSLEAAVVVSPFVTPSAENYSYNYTLFNTEAIAFIGLELMVPVEPLSVTAPPGWVCNQTPSGDGFLVQWFSFSDDAMAPADVAPGGWLGGFVIVVPTGPAEVPFSALNAEMEIISGITDGPAAMIPAAVPEPGTLFSGLAGTVLLLIQRARRS